MGNVLNGAPGALRSGSSHQDLILEMQPVRDMSSRAGRDEKQIQVKFMLSRAFMTGKMMCLALCWPTASLHILWEGGWPLGKVPL